VDISSEEAKSTQFSGTEHSYDAREVEEFRRRVVAALTAYETAVSTPPVASNDLTAAQRVRHQAVELAERMLRDVMGASGDDSASLSAWQEAAMLRAEAEEEMAFAGEEAKRLVTTANAERDEIRSGHETERKQLRAELQNELQVSRAAADAEVEDITAKARSEANEMLRSAANKAEETRQAAAAEAQRLERRIAVLHTALADAEARFRRLAATAANEVGTMQAIIDDDVRGSKAAAPVAAAPPRPELYLASVDLTDEGLAAEPDVAAGDAGETEESIPGLVARDPEIGFYQRRLAGLRDRLEKSGHPPQ
jgi:hypothetical protein